MIDETQELSGYEKSKLPFVLLLDPVTGMAAAYSNTHRLISPVASKQLIEFALAHTATSEAWSEKKYMPTAAEWRALPEWATLEVRRRCVMIWIERPVGSPDYWASFPKR
jgi:hypothetical protein